VAKEQARQRIEKLKKVIAHHRYLYHVFDRQELSDSAFDSLKHELYTLEQQYPQYITPDSPTQRVGGKPLDKFQKIQHDLPMLSIEDVFSEKELEDWEEYLKRLEPNAPFNYFCELKIDGFAISLVYKDGILEVGSTRGDGRVGEDVTQNLKTIESIPLKLALHGKLPNQNIESNLKDKIEKGRVEVRGEVYMGRKDFENFNRKLQRQREKTYANPRNLAAGSIRQLDPRLAGSRPLKFLAYDIITDVGQKSHSEEHVVLPALGFKTDKGKICKDPNEVVDFWRAAAKKRDAFPFQIDGVVVSVDNNALFEKLGVAGKSPRGIRAFKFSAKQATTRVFDIQVQVGRTGAITPLALLQPVKVAGVTISRATLHNEDEIKRLGVRIGDTVIIERAGDVIPAVVKVLPELRTGKEKEFHMPKFCSVCGTKLVKPKAEVVWRCQNKNCPARKKELLYHFASKKAFYIEGLGHKIIDQLSDHHLISRAPDLFALEEGDLMPLERFAEKSASNLIRAIQESKEIPFARFIYALGIRHVGEETAIDLAQYFLSLQDLMRATRDELEAIPGTGPAASRTIYEWFKDSKNQKLITDFLGAGVKILAPARVKKKLSGKTFVLTGTLESMTRQEAEKRIRMLGGSPVGSVSSQTDFVVVGKNPGSKFEKTKKLGVKIIGEEEFLALIK